MEYLSQPGLMLTASLNNYIERVSADDTSAIIDLKKHHLHLYNDLVTNWQAIRKEGEALTNEMTNIKGDLFFTHIADDQWKKKYLKWYGEIDPHMRLHCPVTVSILDKYPTVHLAMFSLLKSGGRILPHAGPFRGSIRVHVGLATPNDPDCYINIGKERYFWKDGEVIAFDDTYRHEVFNNTDKDRLILFLDVERAMKKPSATRKNQWLIKYIAPLTARANSRRERRDAQKN
jgi:beta-hydroxylase